MTGGSGFIGSHICERLMMKGNRVINLDNFSNYYDYKIKIKNVLESMGMTTNFEFYNKAEDLIRLAKKVTNQYYRLYVADITDGKSFDVIFREEKIDAVIHLAANAGVRPSIEDPIGYIDVNIHGTVKLLEKMKEYHVKKLIFASSSSVYGNNQTVPFSEKHNVDFAISPYAATKKSGEVICHTYHHLFEIDMLLLRFFTVYGERQRPDLAIHKFTRLIDEGRAIPFYGDGQSERDYTYIGDIVDGIEKSLHYVENYRNIYEIVNLGESQTISLNEMVTIIEKVLNKKATFEKFPMQPGDVQKTYADISKAKKLLGYKPITVFEDGIKQFIKWYKGDKND
ncbi:GDP-mannose 4,6-dehydratase [Gottfriedia acidiceleris]|uniref:GDP-mannose 4,6-dehydratase n=1 Tax=Gottfriedia acidiceleris TaxID=371036 RepID=UPI0022876537|nr:GDP-mannose 4,6-dehydratase [Gottfriedia acidiceleris]